ncbi:hypothetical protein N7520_002997 [Penicillium odoratum]|uniref:uncharacterized protein n=1 Tax=Penicillium odoratum TaxID=1167516 RepID=UPI0025475F7F|nr:uncharacterized protein N7520_002997 [Penicillium odoratum]KAJ5772468.1 hypothetical protein N7520_002997 [Penicillium odoratum]
MFIISPLSRCASPSKRDIFLDHITKIASVTNDNEPNCHAYAWFKSAEDNDSVPHHWLRGFEVYNDVEANTITHRASAEYKAFRVAVGEDKLLEQPSDLRFWRPINIGFLTRNQSMKFMDNSTTGGHYVVVDELMSEVGKLELIMEHLRGMALEAEKLEQILSFWVLRRDDEKDPAFLVFSCYLDKEAWVTFNGQTEVDEAWRAAHESSKEQRRTTWIESGLGFLGREELHANVHKPMKR